MSERYDKGSVCRVVSRTAYEDKIAVAVRRSDEDRISWIVPAAKHAESMAFADRELRPLVVIDPEDREQVERLVEALDYGGDKVSFATRLQATLREFASPTTPKPDQPDGLGAVVEDGSQFTYTRFSHTEAHAGGDWINEDGARFQWADIAAVRVLSEGVSDA